MRNNLPNRALKNSLQKRKEAGMLVPVYTRWISERLKKAAIADERAGILVITSYPPRECGIATYSQDLITSLERKFGETFSMQICALEPGNQKYYYPEKVRYVLNTSDESAYARLADAINANSRMHAVLIQHEFGLFERTVNGFIDFLNDLIKPVIIVFHTVLPDPSEELRINVKKMIDAAEAIIVMTNNSARILRSDYDIAAKKINVIAHGTHLVPHRDK